MIDDVLTTLSALVDEWARMTWEPYENPAIRLRAALAGVPKASSPPDEAVIREQEDLWVLGQVDEIAAVFGWTEELKQVRFRVQRVLPTGTVLTPELAAAEEAFLAENEPGVVAAPVEDCETCGRRWNGYTSFDGKTETRMCRDTPNADGTWDYHDFKPMACSGSGAE